MQFHPDDFMALSSAVLDDGGLLIEDVCHGEIVKLRFKDGVTGRPEWKRFHTTHCNQAARFDVRYDPYEPIHIVDEGENAAVIASDTPTRPTRVPGMPAEEPHYARVCAVDDAVGLWPRYKDVVSERSYQR